jgi:hypothetical protein
MCCAAGFRRLLVTQRVRGTSAHTGSTTHSGYPSRWVSISRVTWTQLCVFGPGKHRHSRARSESCTAWTLSHMPLGRVEETHRQTSNRSRYIREHSRTRLPLRLRHGALADRARCSTEAARSGQMRRSFFARCSSAIRPRHERSRGVSGFVPDPSRDQRRRHIPSPTPRARGVRAGGGDDRGAC